LESVIPDPVDYFPGLCCHPVRSAARSDALQTRDLQERLHFARSRVCAAAFHAAARTG
jgi:hypothetical protein